VQLVPDPVPWADLRAFALKNAPKLQKYLSLRKAEADLWVDSLAAVAVIVEGEVSRPVVADDPADDIYIGAATDGLADFIVSGDRHLLGLGGHGRIRIVSPRLFLDLLDA
jgi:predicted nucleic acid-binding protein